MKMFALAFVILASAIHSTTWENPPEIIELNYLGVSSPTIVTDLDGNAYAAWGYTEDNSSFFVGYAERPVGGTWENVQSFPTANNGLPYVGLAISASNTRYLAFTYDLTETVSGLAIQGSVGFGTPSYNLQTILYSQQLQSMTVTASPSPDSDFAIALLQSQQNGDQGTQFCTVSLYPAVSTLQNQYVWVYPATVSMTADPTVAIDGSNNAVVAWSSAVNGISLFSSTWRVTPTDLSMQNPPNFSNSIVTVYNDDSGAVGTAAIAGCGNSGGITNNILTATLLSNDPAGTTSLYALYTEDGGAIWNPSVPTPLGQLPSTAYTSLQLSLATQTSPINSDTNVGTAALSYQDQNGVYQVVAMTTPDVTAANWTVSDSLASNMNSLYYVSAGIDPSGNSTVIWALESDSDVVQGATMQYATSWSSSQTVAYDMGGSFSGDTTPMVASYGNGAAIAIWSANFGTYNIETATYLHSFGPFPPSNLKGFQQLNRFVNYAEYFNTLSWNASSSSEVTGYQISRNGVTIATVPSTQLFYIDHNQSTIGTTYEVVAANNDGTSFPVSITL